MNWRFQMPTTPLISVITACLNSSRHIGQTLESVAAQQGVDCEHIIADGGSSDSTLAIVESKIRAGGRWLTGPDSGIAEAMNNGLAIARGEWLLFLQSDDYLCNPTVLAEAARHFTADVDICGFPVIFGSEDSATTMQPRGAGFWLNFKTGLNHQGTFIRRCLFERIGGYDTSFRIAMDYEFFLRAYRAGAKFGFHAQPVVSLMRDTGISSQLDWPNLKKRFAEEERVHRKFQTPGLALLYDAWWAVYPKYRKFKARRRLAT